MTLQAPNLDDRKFQDIVREARSKIPLYCPKWTDYNLSDPGITLIELFAWMVDILLYRLNRVPEKNYIKFMELIGIQLKPPEPATANVTFRLSAPQPETVVIPKGTEVATVRTETQDAVTFATSQNLVIIVPKLDYALTTKDDASFEDCMPVLKNPDLQVTIFEEVPKENNALYLGYGANLGGQTLALTIEGSVEGIGVDPRNPPLVWEYWDGDLGKWAMVRLESDTTGGLNTNGQIILHIPATAKLKEINGKSACWIRCRAVKPLPRQRPYGSSPKIRSITSDCIGGTMSAKHAFSVPGEVLGRSDGTPGQKFTLQNNPVLPRESGETIEVEKETPEEFEPWHEVKDFAGSGPDDLCFTCDSVSGEIQFGPSIRLPSGGERQYGKIPPAGRQILFTSYRCGGGVVGNVGERTITVLKSSIPYVASVANLEAAKGGLDAETLEHAKMRVPEVLKGRTRAVTADDFEYFALASSPSVARAKCVCPGATDDGQGMPAGMVRLLVVPVVPGGESPIPNEALELTRTLKEKLQSCLDERRLLATHLEIAAPQYQPVSVTAKVKAKAGSDLRQVTSEVEKRLYRYVNPVHGGPDGKGWPFGRSLSLSEIYAAIQGVANVEYIMEAQLFEVDANTGERQESTAKITISPNSLICSGKHEIIVE